VTGDWNHPHLPQPGPIYLRDILFSRLISGHKQKKAKMGSQNFILSYVQACTSGKLALSECGPVWQLGIIVALLASAITVLILLRLRAYARSARS
jgi:hypothetical protein